MNYLSREGFYNSDTVQQKQELSGETNFLRAARNFNEEALTKIFDLYVAPLYNYALRLTGDELLADNIVGDTFSKFLDQLHAGKGPNNNLRSYLYQTTYHLIVDEVRFNKREAPLEIADCLFNIPSHKTTQILDQTDEKSLLDNVFEAIIEHLSEDQRHVIILRFLEDFSIKETAEIIGKEVNNVKVIQNRGIAKLRKVLGIQLGEKI